MAGAVPPGTIGVVEKWTNLLKGSQQRFLVLDAGMLKWFKVSGAHRAAVLQHETSATRRIIGDKSRDLIAAARRDSGGDAKPAGPPPAVRGLVHLSQVLSVTPSDWEDVKFSVVTTKETLDLRCDTAADRAAWIEALHAHKAYWAAPRDAAPAVSRADSRVLATAEAAAAKLSRQLQELGCGPEAVILVHQQLEEMKRTTLSVLSSERAKRRLLRARIRELEEDKARLEATLVLEAHTTNASTPPLSVGRSDGPPSTSSASAVPRRSRRSSSGTADGSVSDADGGGVDGTSEDEDEELDDVDTRRPSLDEAMSDEDDVDVSAAAQEDGTEFFDCQDTLSAKTASALASAVRSMTVTASQQTVPQFPPPWGDARMIVPTRRRFLPAPLEQEIRPSLWTVIKGAVGKDLTRITLPVTFNEPLSALQKFAEELQYAELLTAAASAPKSSNDRLLLVAAFAVSGYSSAVGRGLKPFNPLERETFEFVCPERGWRFLGEKVRHHPLHVAAYAEGPGWVFWGETSIQTRFTGRSIQLVPSGQMYVRFADGDVYSWKKIPSTVTNIILGPLAVEYAGTTRVVCLSTGTALRLRFKEPGMLVGSSSETRQVRGFLEPAQGAAASSKDAACVLQGAWDSSLSVVDASGSSTRCLWRNRPGSPASAPTRYNFSPFASSLNEMPPEGEDGVLPPTDSRLRPDQRMLEEGRFTEANVVKLRLEEAQRLTRKKLADSGLVPSPRWFRPAALDDVLASGGRSPPGPPAPAAVPLAQLGLAAGAPAGENGLVFAYVGGYWESRQAGDWSHVAPIFSAGATTAAE